MFCVPANAGLINVLGLEGIVPVKPSGGDVKGPADDGAADARSRGKS